MPICERSVGAENRSRYGRDTILGMQKTGCFGNWVLKWRKELKFYKHDAKNMSLFSLNAVK